MSVTAVNVRVDKAKGPARTRFSIEFEMYFDPLDPEQTRAFIDKLWALMNEFGSPEEVGKIRAELLQQLSQAAAPVKAEEA